MTTASFHLPICPVGQSQVVHTGVLRNRAHAKDAGARHPTATYTVTLLCGIKPGTKCEAICRVDKVRVDKVRLDKVGG